MVIEAAVLDGEHGGRDIGRQLLDADRVAFHAAVAGNQAAIGRQYRDAMLNLKGLDLVCAGKIPGAPANQQDKPGHTPKADDKGKTQQRPESELFPLLSVAVAA